MAKLSIVAGATSQSITVFIQNSASTTGAGLTGLVFNTSGLTAYYTFTGVNTLATAITLATLAAVGSAFSSGGFKEIDSTNMPGMYRLDLPNAAITTARGRSVVLYLQGAAGMAPCVLEIELTGWDNQDAVHGGMSALPNTACTTNASLLTSGTGTDQISNTSGRVDVGKTLGTAVTLDANSVLNVSTKYVGGTLQTARDLGASVLLSAGTGTGQLDFTSGVVKANLAQILGTALTETAGQIAAAFKKLFDVAAPVLTATSVNQTGDAFARLGAPAGASVSADVAAVNAKTTNLPASPAATGAQMDLVNAPNATALNAAADALLDRAAGIESGWTLRQGCRMFLASLAGLLSGAATTTVTITNPANTKNRIIATVDANGNRSAITYDAS